LGIHALNELEKERLFGTKGEESDRHIPVIDFSDFGNRKDEIANALWAAATTTGFFQIVGHVIPSDLIDTDCDQAARYFDQRHEAQAHNLMARGTNTEWDDKPQIRPLTGTADQKESYQITVPRMAALWPWDLPEFKTTMLAFEQMHWMVAMQTLSCLATNLSFEPEMFLDGHDPLRPEYQSTFRLLHYLPLITATPKDLNEWRAGAYSDFDCLTLLHQRRGQSGLQVCPGQDPEGSDPTWTDVPAEDHVITCNIEDMVMRWSDDRLISNLHRVRTPRPDENLDARHSIAFFAQANQDTLLAGPLGHYEPVTAHDDIQMRPGSNFKKTTHAGIFMRTFSDIRSCRHHFDFHDKFGAGKSTDDHKCRRGQMGYIHHPSVAGHHVPRHMTAIGDKRTDFQCTVLRCASIPQDHVDVGKNQIGLRFCSIRDAAVRGKRQLSRGHDQATPRNTMRVSGERWGHALRNTAFDHLVGPPFAPGDTPTQCKPET
jgi:isopenicillin N synthase-like dioxygenase